MQRRNLLGDKFGNLTVVTHAGKDKSGAKLWLCQCDCGNMATVRTDHLISGHTQSCGCLWKRIRDNQISDRNPNYKHGGKGTKLYWVWCSMRARCNRKTDKRYDHYGGRGIEVCSEWDDFSVFREWAYSTGYREGLSIERRDNDGDYCPGNCIWATPKIQANNQSTTTFIKIGDVEKPLHVWAEFIGIHPEALRNRLYRGWPVERALFEKTSLDKHHRSMKSQEANLGGGQT